MAPTCRARLLSDLTAQTACDKEATSSNGRLCAFHARQCQALYRGYKRRNAELDTLPLPSYLATKKASIITQDFTDTTEEATLREVHDYLFRRYNLVDRVIRARKLHHSHFFAIDNDYGHEKYLDRLQNDRYNMIRALERLGRQAATIMYEKKQWFNWIKQCQEKEDREAENESKKVKLESLLFKRHQKEVARHQREMRSKEDKKRQEQFLNEVYTQRLSEMSEEEQEEWDPIHDVYGYERDNYVDLIRFFLMLEDEEQIDESPVAPDASQPEGSSEVNPIEKAVSKSAKKRARKANAETRKMEDPTAGATKGKDGKIIEMETKEQMRVRLGTPVKFERSSGWYMDNLGGHLSMDALTPVLPHDEIEQLLGEIAEIKNFLFCRLLLAQSGLLPLALQANSIEEFLEMEEVTREHLRDLCLKLERPSLQDVRDACADFIRERDGLEEPEEDSTEDADDYPDQGHIPPKYRVMKEPRGSLPDKYRTKREKAAKKKTNKKNSEYNSGDDGMVDFGNVTNESDYFQKRMKIRVCGRDMYNYRSEKALSRSGWFHFSLIAKDSDLFDAVALCRNWNEFFELNILCLYHYFPAAKWTRFIGDLPRQQLMQLGFIPYFIGDKAEQVTHYFQTGGRGMARRSHSVMEMRNFICGHIKRDDPVSRRFIQYLSMETWELRALVRDRKTGRILIKPPKDELWLLREKSGWGRAAKNDFEIVGEVGPGFFEKMEALRSWQLNFEEYYDVYIWATVPGEPVWSLRKKLQEVLARALRVRGLKDMFSATRDILQTITKDPKTGRVRSVKPGQEVETMWDAIDYSARSFTYCPDGSGEVEEMDQNFSQASYTYTEADELEDAILFPQEVDGQMTDNLFRHDKSALELFESESVDVRRFAADLDTDEEPADSDLDSEFDDQELDEDQLAALEDDDGDPDWGSDEVSSTGDGDEYVLESEIVDMDKAIEVLSKQFKGFGMMEPDYYLPILRNPASARQLPASVRNSPGNLMHTLRQSLRCQKNYNINEAAIEADFFRLLDRQKSKVFKQSFHLGDLEPGALSRYLECRDMVDAMDKFVMTSGINPGPFELCKFMQMAQLFYEERRIVDDAFKAYASIALFFETEEFLASNNGKPFRDSQLLKQEERAKQLPDRRTHLSNRTMPKEFWKDWDKLLKDNKRTLQDDVEDIYPMEWRKAMRPAIIRLFKAGIICSSYSGISSGVAVAAAEPNRPLDLYFDYRGIGTEIKALSHLTDPRPFDRDYIVRTASRFQAEHASAKFSVLRLWSSPHFYPLMHAWDKRHVCTFTDDRGRCWEFKFIPKDMPFSEWSVHQQLKLRLQPFQRVFGKQVVLAKDLMLVMGNDEKDCRRLSEGVTWLVQTQPWRLEIDFWRSFVNVDAKFLEALHPKWLE
ncbi:hypothetical protein BDW02DRAFT_558680 [Decorospora gaudefroyi]|uniref:Uncharacterized protein n=1 Tax=Decorospora gaudefroyi TaxID=184978 RepID=A0A6A5K6W2_9PLEO|nr:hypothetical protein BDW02DRAFT_558680 [Decorospora gaudefroyi]